MTWNMKSWFVDGLLALTSSPSANPYTKINRSSPKNEDCFIFN